MLTLLTLLLSILLHSTLCQVTSQGCAQSYPGGFCVSCLDTYYLRYNSCQRCPEQCQTCESRTICTSCKPTLQLYQNKCFECRLPGCFLCQRSNVCKQCEDGYYLDGGICKKCGDDCELCDQDGECVMCEDGFVIDGDGEECVIQQNNQNGGNGGSGNGGGSADGMKPKTIRQLQVGLGIMVSVIVIAIVTFISVKLFRKHQRSLRIEGQNPHPSPRPSLQYPQNPLPAFSSSVLLVPATSKPPIKSYVKPSPLETSRDICAICLSQNTDIRTSCTHQFHTECMILWCRKKYICPDCNNQEFTLRVKCEKCREFRKVVKFCGMSCKEKDHFQCFKERNRGKMMCGKCER